MSNDNNKRDKLVKVSLSGTAITESGQVTKSDFFNFIRQDLDDYSDIEFTPEEARRISNHLRKLSTGSTAMVPMYCAGQDCPFADRCPLVEMNKAPVSRQCPIEIELLKDWIIKYFEEYDVDPNNFTEVGYINELAEIEIYLLRLNMNIARAANAELVIDQEVGTDVHGKPLIQKQISPFMEMKDKLLSRRSRIIKLMVGDRQEKYKKEAALKIKLESDSSSQQAQIRAKLDAINRRLLSTSIEEEHTTISPQDIIDGVYEEEE
jgi:hypothetical protein